MLGNPHFLTAANISIVLQQAAILAVLATGMTGVILTGGIDLSVGSTLAAAATAAVVVSFLPWLGVLGIAAGVATGLALGCVNGWAVAALRLPPALVTLAAFAIVRALARLLGADRPLDNPRLAFAFIGNRAVGGIPLLVILALGVVPAARLLLRYSLPGRRMRALDGSPGRAGTEPVAADRALILAYGAAGLLAGLGGVMSAARLFSANTLEAGQSYGLDAVAAALLGGARPGGEGSAAGILLGALLIVLLTNGLLAAGLSDGWIIGAKTLVVAAALAPGLRRIV